MKLKCAHQRASEVVKELFALPITTPYEEYSRLDHLAQDIRNAIGFNELLLEELRDEE